MVYAIGEQKSARNLRKLTRWHDLLGALCGKDGLLRSGDWCARVTSVLSSGGGVKGESGASV